MKDIRAKAKELMKGACRVCPVCDGHVCVGEVPGMGGLGQGEAFKDNVRALSEISLNMRLIHDAKEPSTKVSWLGYSLDMPVIASPIGGKFNFNDAVTEEEYIMAVVQGAQRAGSIGSTGDGVPPDLIDAALAAGTAVKGHAIPFIKPWENEELDEKIERALKTGCSVMGMDIDAAGLVTLRKMGRPVGPKTVKELSKIADKLQRVGVKFLVKGIMTASDACLAVEAGADGIVVSNHGGRVLSSAPGAARVLANIADAVRGKVSIMADGGVRTGADVLKLLALGADVVGIGRPVAVAAIGGGAEGVAIYLKTIRDELAQAMILTGCSSVTKITRSVLLSCSH